MLGVVGGVVNSFINCPSRVRFEVVLTWLSWLSWLSLLRLAEVAEVAVDAELAEIG